MRKIVASFSEDNRVKLAYGGTYLLLLLSFMVSWYITKNIHQQTQFIKSANTTLSTIDSLSIVLKEFEYAALYLNNSKGNEDVDTLHHIKKDFLFLVSDLRSPENTALKDSLLTAVVLRYTNLNGLASTGVLEASLGDSLKLIRSDIARIQNNEKAILQNRADALVDRFNILSSLIISALIVSSVLFLLGLRRFIIDKRERRKLEKQKSLYQEAIEDRNQKLDIAQEKLEKMGRMEKYTSTGRIARTIAHEIRNPLTNINLSVDQLKAYTDEEERNMFYDMILRNSDRINKLITALLNSTRFLELEKKPYSINKLLDEVLADAMDSLQLKGITVKKRYNNNIKDVEVDVEKLKIAFLNVIINAVDAMQPNTGVLTVSTRKINNTCVIIIEDNGKGIDKATLAKIFEPYFTGKANGSGLGLTNVENIMVSHEGNITIDSKPGVGTACYFTLKMN